MFQDPRQVNSKDRARVMDRPDWNLDRIQWLCINNRIDAEIRDERAENRSIAYYVIENPNAPGAEYAPMAIGFADTFSLMATPVIGDYEGSHV